MHRNHILRGLLYSILGAAAVVQAANAPAPAAGGHSQPHGPAGPLPKPPSAPPGMPPTAPVPMPKPPPPHPIELPHPLPPIPPAWKPPKTVKLTTQVPPPINPKVMSTRGGNPAQVFLGNIDDMRDIGVALENTRAQALGAKASTKAYEEILARQKQLLATDAISREDYAQSAFEVASNRAKAKLYDAKVRSLQAQFDRYEYQAKMAAHQVTFDIKTYYEFYRRDWDAQCEMQKADVEGAQAQYDLNNFAYQVAEQLYRENAGSYYEYQQKYKDFVAAREDLAAKQSLDAKCAQGQPSLADVEKIQAAG